jgi:hypothetical protein
MSHWLLTSQVTGLKAAIYALFFVLVPTLVSISARGIAPDVSPMPYIPFVLLAALFLGWRYAACVVLASAFISDFWFLGPPDQILEGATDVFALACFTIASVMIVALVEGMRRSAAPDLERGESMPPRSGAIVFSLEGGEAWASWYGSEKPVRLGPEDEVEAMMKDFLAQLQLGRRLTAQLN